MVRKASGPAVRSLGAPGGCGRVDRHLIEFKASRWTNPGAIGRGLASALWEDAGATARARGCRTLLVQSDPHAAGFYRAMGARPDGTKDSTVIPGLVLPLLRLDLG